MIRIKILNHRRELQSRREENTIFRSSASRDITIVESAGDSQSMFSALPFVFDSEATIIVETMAVFTQPPVGMLHLMADNWNVVNRIIM